MQLLQSSKRELRLDWLRPSTDVNRWTTVAGVIAVLLILLLGSTSMLLEQRNEALRRDLSAVQAQLNQEAATKRNATGERLEKGKRAQTLIAQHNAIAAALEALERVDPKEVSIESVSINPESRTLQIELRAVEVSAISRYVESFNRLNVKQAQLHVASMHFQQPSGQWQATLESR